MPTYEFKCRTCGHEFEKMQGMNDPNPICPRFVPCDPFNILLIDGVEHLGGHCGGPTDKLITHSSFVLKGDGWASDGYGGGAGK